MLVQRKPEAKTQCSPLHRQSSCRIPECRRHHHDYSDDQTAPLTFHQFQAAYNTKMIRKLNTCPQHNAIDATTPS